MSSDKGRRSSRGRGRNPTSNRSSSAALQASVATTHRDTSRSRSPRDGSPHDSVPRTESSRSTTSHAGSSRGRSSRGRASRGRASRGRASRPGRNVKISHILIKHKNCRRPIDSNNKPVTRTKDKAMSMVINIHRMIYKDLITFADAAVSYSECRSARRGGDLQKRFEAGRVIKSFEEAAFYLAPGQMSHIIESNSGYHILQRRE